MNLYGFFKGYNEMGDALASEGLKREHLTSLKAQNADQAMARDLETRARRASVPPVDALPTAMSSTGVLGPALNETPFAAGPSMAAAGVAPAMPGDETAPYPEPPRVLQAQQAAAPSASVPAPPAQAPAQKVEVRGSKADPVADGLRRRMDFYVQEGRPDLAASAQQTLSQYHTNKAAEAKARFELTLGPEAQDLTRTKLLGEQSAASESLVNQAARLHALGDAAGSAALLNTINELTTKAGRPMWATGQTAGSLQPSEDRRKMVLMDTQGQPIMGSDGKPYSFGTVEWARRGGVDAERKIIQLKPGEKAFEVTRTGAREMASGGDPLTGAEKATFVRSQVNDTVKGINEGLFNLTVGMDGRMMGTVEKGQEQRRTDYLRLAEKAVQDGADPQAVVATLNEHYLRDKASGAAYSRAKLPTVDQLKSGKIAGVPGVGGGSAADKVRQKFGF